MKEYHGGVHFEELLVAVLDGVATEAERAEFSQLLDEEPALVEIYMRQSRMHVMLESCAGLRSGGLKNRNWKRGEGTWRRWTAAAAAMVLLAGVAFWWTESVRAPVATVKTSRHGQWADGRKVVAGAVLQPGVWNWQCGLIELITRSGTVLLVEAPASIEIVDAMHARLLEGKLVVRMPKGRSGYVVETSDMKVLDLGTEFGVSVASTGESWVQVFDGRVLAETAGQTSARRELKAGETVRVDARGVMAEDAFDESRFIRRFPFVHNPKRPSGVLYSRSRFETVRVAHAAGPVAIDGDLGEWPRVAFFRNACDAPYASAYWLEGVMMYDSTNLYLAAHVGDPDPMLNASPQGFEFAGGSVIVRVSADRKQGWPLKATMFVDGVYDPGRTLVSEAARSDRITSIVMWYDAQAARARIKLFHGLDEHAVEIDPPGWNGVFRKDADGRGYTLEYVIPWGLLNCADDPPRGGDVLAALWMVHWSDADGRLARGQLVEVTNHQPHPQDSIPPYIFFQNGPSWGKAVYMSKDE